jgi:tetratricopeptide (TPR) repeat protein
MHGEAYRFALLAAERASAVYAPHEALEYLAIAQRHGKPGRDTAEVAARMADAAEAAGEYDTALQFAREALAHFRTTRELRRVLALRRLEIRVRGLFGASASQTLAETDALVQEARAANAHDEEAALLTLSSRLHQRLGDSVSAIMAASSATAAAERAGERRGLAEAVVRLGICVEPEHPDTAVEHYRRALALYRELGDPRGQSHCHNNLGIVYARRGEVEYAERELTTAIVLGRTISAPDLSGLFTLNLGVIHLKRGQLDRARELIGESLAQFAAVKNSERQVFALLNLAHLDREQGNAEGAASLYEAVISLAQRIGQDDVEIGALAGAALVLRAQGRHAEAERRATEASARSAARGDWFQGRELVEAMELAEWCATGRAAAALDRYERSMLQAEAADLFSAVWLAAEVLPQLTVADRGFAEMTLWRYALIGGDRGYTGVAARCAAAAGGLANGGTSVA